jgi:hypothetical protein
MRVVAGGCHPPTWPRPPKHPVPEPTPESLDEQVDWMTYSHPELYKMVHKGVDLAGAMHVSAQWARLGDELADIGDELSRLLAATVQAWQGESAELARDSVSSLADWSRDTGVRATEVSGCIIVQVGNATAARNAMPEPPYPEDPKPADGVVMPLDAAFVSGDFASAAPLVADPAQYSKREKALHRQAARTMETFQETSRDVYATVPQFAPPDLRRLPHRPPTEPPPPQPPAQPPTPQPQAQQTVPSVLPPGGPAGSAPPRTSGGPGAGPAPRPPMPPGAGVGATEPAPAGRPAAASATGSTGRGSGAMGGVPMGGHGAQGGEDAEHKRKKYAGEGDDDVWGLADQPYAPPVIGEVNRRA